jgi:nuclear pore complex protein Nup107
MATDGAATSEVVSPSWEQLEVGPEVETFANKLDECLSGAVGALETRHRVLRLVDDYFEYATNQTTSLRRAWQFKNGASFNNDHEDVGENHNRARSAVRRWEQEAQTWDLLRRLLPLRYPVPSSVTITPVAERRNNGGDACVSCNIWQEFLDAEPSAIERSAILQWTQQNTDTGLHTSGFVKEPREDTDQGNTSTGHHGYIHTKSSIKLRKRLVAVQGPISCNDKVAEEAHLTNTGALLAIHLDPDVVAREDRQLQHLDGLSERALSQGFFYHLRRGSSIETIRDWCNEHTEIWRAVSMSALPPNISAVGGGDGVNYPNFDLHDPETLILWRRMCFYLCRNGGSNDYERAVYGTLAGDVQSVESVCANWNDLVFARYNALLRSQFDAYLVRHKASATSAALCHAFPISDAIHLHGDTTIEAGLMHDLEFHAKAGLEAIQPLKALQAAIISHKLDLHLHDQGVILALDANATNPSHLMPMTGELSEDVNRAKHIDLSDHVGLRILAHVFFIVSILDRLNLHGSVVLDQTKPDLYRQQCKENVLVGYVSFLRLAGLEDLVPLYCSELREPRVYEVLHSNVIHLTDEATRLHQLDLMRKAALSPLNFVTAQSGLVLGSLPLLNETKFEFRIMETLEASLKYGRTIRTDFFGEEPDHVDHADDVLIRTVEWQVLVDEAWPGLFSVIVRLYKYFLVHGRLNAARSLANRIGCLNIIQRRLVDTDEEFDPLWRDNAKFWAHQFDGTSGVSQPYPNIATDAKTLRELESLIWVLDAMETLATLAAMSKQDPTLKRDFWTKVGNEVKTINHHIHPLLRNWLQGSIQDNEFGLQTIRDMYLTETVLAYISCLHFAGTCLSRDYLLECMELAAMIAGKDSDVAATFTRCNRMVELVEAFAACSKALAIITSETRPTTTSTKKTRETGWSRDLWSVENR